MRPGGREGKREERVKKLREKERKKNNREGESRVVWLVEHDRRVY